MFLLDENTHGAFPDAIRRFNRAGLARVDAIRVGEPGAPPLGSRDEELLIWCEENGRNLVSEDVTSLPRQLAAHLAAGRHLPGILFVKPGTTIRQLYDDLALITEAGSPADFADRYQFIPR